MSDWYGISRRDIEQIGGEVLFHEPSNSLQKVLARVYPDVKWDPGRFVLKAGRSLSNESLLAALATIEMKLEIRQVSIVSIVLIT